MYSTVDCISPFYHQWRNNHRFNNYSSNSNKLGFQCEEGLTSFNLRKSTRSGSLKLQRKRKAQTKHLTTSNQIVLFFFLELF